jgi:hypothetical protein
MQANPFITLPVGARRLLCAKSAAIRAFLHMRVDCYRIANRLACAMDARLRWVGEAQLCERTTALKSTSDGVGRYCDVRRVHFTQNCPLVGVQKRMHVALKSDVSCVAHINVQCSKTRLRHTHGRSASFDNESCGTQICADSSCVHGCSSTVTLRPSQFHPPPNRVRRLMRTTRDTAWHNCKLFVKCLCSNCDHPPVFWKA